MVLYSVLTYLHPEVNFKIFKAVYKTIFKETANTPAQSLTIKKCKPILILLGTFLHSKKGKIGNYSS